jgi:hypothetical protein
MFTLSVVEVVLHKWSALMYLASDPAGQVIPVLESKLGRLFGALEAKRKYSPGAGLGQLRLTEEPGSAVRYEFVNWSAAGGDPLARAMLAGTSAQPMIIRTLAEAATALLMVSPQEHD